MTKRTLLGSRTLPTLRFRSGSWAFSYKWSLTFLSGGYLHPARSWGASLSWRGAQGGTLSQSWSLKDNSL